MNGLFSTLFGYAAPYIQDTIATVVAAAAAWLFTLLQSKFKLNIEQSRRDALTASATRVAGELFTEISAGHVSLGELFSTATDGTVAPNTAHPVVAQKVAKVVAAAPDAIKALGLKTSSGPDIATIASKIFGALGPMLAMAGGPVGMAAGVGMELLGGLAGPSPTAAVAR